MRENYDFMYVISVDAGVCVRMLMRRVCLQCVCVYVHIIVHVFICEVFVYVSVCVHSRVVQNAVNVDCDLM